MKVYYSGGGRHVLLQWWTHGEQCHIILARGLLNLHQVAARVFRRDWDADIKAFCEIEIVAPPSRLSHLAREHDRKERVKMFHVEVTCSFQKAVKERMELPLPLRLCPTYEKRHERDGDDEDPWEAETHYDCKNCQDEDGGLGGVQLVGITMDELYDRYHEAWRKVFPGQEHKEDPKLVTSCAPPSRDDEPLWCAVADFGHHAGGVALVQENGSTPRNVMFYFRRLGELDRTLVQKVLTEEQRKVEERKEEVENKLITEHVNKDQEELNKAFRFFTDRAK